MPETKNSTRPLPAVERLRELFRYEPETGLLIRIAKSSIRGNVGEVVGSKNGTGYLYACLDSGRFLIHRIAYKMMTGVDPGEHFIDHINGDRGDNRFDNLRLVSKAENGHNSKRNSRNTSGTVGVVWCKDIEKWVARITVDMVTHFLGYYKNLEDAVAARKAAEKFYGFSDRHGESGKSLHEMTKPPMPSGAKARSAAERQSGIVGIVWSKRDKKWAARYKLPEERHERYVGRYDTVEEALQAQLAAKKAAGLL